MEGEAPPLRPRCLVLDCDADRPETSRVQSISDFVSDLKREGVELWVDSGRLHYRAPRGSLSEQHVQALRDRKTQILALLSAQRVAAIERELEAADGEVRPIASPEPGE